MAGPPEQMPAAADRGDLRASHADREQVIGTLKAAFVQGRLANVLASRTYAELATVTADLPAGLTAYQPSEPARAPARHPGAYHQPIREGRRRPQILMTGTRLKQS